MAFIGSNKARIIKNRDNTANTATTINQLTTTINIIEMEDHGEDHVAEVAIRRIKTIGK